MKLLPLAQIISLAILSLPYHTVGFCRTNCSTHGYCGDPEDKTYACHCHPGYAGADCSRWRCPTGKAWADKPTGSTTAHADLAECSNAGACDETSGKCVCEAGFAGMACERLDCLNDCNGHGKCLTADEFHYWQHRSLVSQPAVDSNIILNPLTYTYTAWDRDMLTTCICDEGWTGRNCATLDLCPKGDDPLTLGQVSEMQILECTCKDSTCAGKSFVLGFRRGHHSARMYFTAVIDAATANAVALKTALTTIADIPDISIVVQGSGATVCSVAGTKTVIAFTHTPGAIAALQAIAIKGLTLGVKSSGATSGSLTSVKNTREFITCSGRGRCMGGQYCDCYSGFSSSSGAFGAQGLIGDCGYFSGSQSSPTDCPVDQKGNMCSEHGQCVGYAHMCVCDPGYTGRACGSRECPFGTDWFGVTSTADKHTTNVMCSNRGSCDSQDGKCTCDAPFTGAACHLMRCPHSKNKLGISVACGEYGVCKTLRELNSVYTSPWDADKIQACDCVKNHYHGPLAGDKTDWVRYDCMRKVCPTGDDPLSSVKENVECSNRGVCDTTTGRCNCFTGYCSSGISVDKPGTNGDCSYRSADC